jgi:hypothetical protein
VHTYVAYVLERTYVVCAKASTHLCRVHTYVVHVPVHTHVAYAHIRQYAPMSHLRRVPAHIYVL